MTPPEIMKAKSIVDDVMREHMVSKEDFNGRSREAPLVAARVESARRLKAEGYTLTDIAMTLGRSPSTVTFYLYPRVRERKEAQHLSRYPLKWLDPEVARIVRTYAEAFDTTPKSVLIEWITERANYEADARARDAA